ncbi:MAG: peroxiredoxin [Marinilabiliales bacterium]|nr:MAG: peroxiredoxin [Marinilabiliales bacterium]
MEKEVNKFPLIGEKMPEMTVATTHGPKNIPGDYKGKWIVLFSHPADFTPVCTTEFIGFAKRAKEFEELNAQLIGLSVDQVFSHIKWVEWIKEKMDVEIPFPVIADPLGTVSMSMGMIHPAKGSETTRAVFLIDPEGAIRIILFYPQEIGRNIDEILRALKALQVHEKYKVAVPANWPNNEIIGDHVIVPPAKSEAEAKERLKMEGAFDWWFVHKKI